MTNEEIITKLFDKETESSIVSLFNEWCDGDDMIYSLDEDSINELFSSPYEALRAWHYGYQYGNRRQENSMGAAWFCFNGYDNISTIPYLVDYIEMYADDGFAEYVAEELEYNKDEEDEEDEEK